MSRWYAILGLSICSLFVTVPAHSETIWERAKNPELIREKRVLRSLYRTLEGTGDALDQMTARTAFVDLARGQEYHNQAIIVLLLRLRRQLGLEALERSRELLSGALDSRQPRSIQALGALEMGHVLLQWEREDEARRFLADAATSAWLPEVASEALMLKGWSLFRAQRVAVAEVDFRRILEMEVGRRRLAVALMSLSCIKESLGDLEKARVFLARGQAVAESRAQASGAGLFSGADLGEEAVALLKGLPQRLEERVSGQRPKDRERGAVNGDGEKKEDDGLSSHPQ